MSHSGDFARWPHLGPIRPMARGGHLGPLSYVDGYMGGVGRSGVGQDTTREDDIEIRAELGGSWELRAACFPAAAAGSSEGLIARTPTPLPSEEARSAARQLDVCA